MKRVFLFFVALSGLSLFGSDNNNPPPSHEKNPAVEKALQECAATIGKDSSGRPDMAKMDACMRDKGFKKPPHPPKDGERPPMRGSEPAVR